MRKEVERNIFYALPLMQITGRMDDVINVSGHRLGTAEVEDVLAEHPLVAEAAVVGYPHEVKGSGTLHLHTRSIFF